MPEMSDAKKKEIETRKRLGRRLPRSESAPFRPTAEPARGYVRPHPVRSSHPTRDSPA